MDEQDEKIDRLIRWVNESKDALREYKAQAWAHCRAVDGEILTDSEKQKMIDSGIEPQEINRIFPVVNLLVGSQRLNPLEIDAKGRTVQDAEISQTMTECIKFCMDQNGGTWPVSEAFEAGIKGGIGFLYVGRQADPRRETIQVEVWPWEECWWDPFGSVWLERGKTRYFFRQRWMDVAALKALFPAKKREIDDAVSALVDGQRGGTDRWEDQADEKEQARITAGDWVQGRKRCKPVEMYYIEDVRVVFAILPGDRVVEIRDEMEEDELAAIYQQAEEIRAATVPKLRVCQFLGKTVLYDGEAPYQHDLFPVVPFVAYLDTYGVPYGVVKQILGQAKEIVKRRSMALEMIRARRVIMERGAVDSPADAEHIYQEANKIDGQMVVRDGALSGGKIKMEEQAPMAGPQMDMMRQSELEIQEVSGANDEMMGYKGRVQSGVAIERRQEQAATITASLFDNYRRSMRRLGELLYLAIQQAWKGPKVLRITDRMSGAEKFVELNKPVMDGGGQRVENDITQGRYDIVISDAPATDTIREKNLELLAEWIKKSPPEVIPVLYDVAMEMSGLPNKHVLMARIRPLLGIPQDDPNMSSDEIKAQQEQQIAAKQEQEQKQQQMLEAMTMEELKGKQLQNEKIMAEIEKIRSETVIRGNQEKRADEEAGIRAFKDGVGIQQKIGGAGGQGNIPAVS